MNLSPLRVGDRKPNGHASPPQPVVGPEIRQIEQRIAEAGRFIEPLRREIGRVIVGQRGLVDAVLTGVLTGGHLLLEGVPGLAKTLALKTLAGSIRGASFSRVQFTPDMLPSDITGTTIYHAHSASFEVKHGRVFANLVLADEINRAPAKVQSALLEAMQERQVTLGNESFALPDPFLVMATQNPLEQEGTYPLPEAQMDRFMFKVVVDYPTASEERAIVDAMATSRPRLDVSPVVDVETLLAARRGVDEVYVDDAIRDYIVRIVGATRDNSANSAVHGLLRAGASPRATIALTVAARATAFLQGRGYVVPADIKALAPDVLRHRLPLSFAAEAEGVNSDEVIRRVLHEVVSP